ncbi:MAG: hypothetical protein COA31_014720 [Flavobacteriales bacterium]|nr:hypothetical protein [Flavobacteriales bacterium]
MKHRKKHKIISLILLSLFLTSFFVIKGQNFDYTHTQPNENNTYNKKELKLLGKLLSVFDEHLVTISREKNISNAYHLFFEELKYIESEEDFRQKTKIGTSKHEALLDKISKNKMFNDIWIYEYGRDIYTKDTNVVYLNLNMEGKYLEFLKNYGKSAEMIKNYHLAIETSSGISPSISLSFLQLHDKFDFNKNYNRLIWMVHFITITSEREYINNNN